MGRHESSFVPDAHATLLGIVMLEIVYKIFMMVVQRSMRVSSCLRCQAL
jgi:hypothetical protein